MTLSMAWTRARRRGWRGPTAIAAVGLILTTGSDIAFANHGLRMPAASGLSPALLAMLTGILSALLLSGWIPWLGRLRREDPVDAQRLLPVAGGVAAW